MRSRRTAARDDVQVAFARVQIVAVMALLALLVATMAATPATAARLTAPTGVIVLVDGPPAPAMHAVARQGGTVGHRYDTLGGFSATIPAAGIAALRTVAGVVAVEVDDRAHLTTTGDPDFDPLAHPGSLWWLGEMTGAHDLWRTGITGSGVDVAMIDSGVVPVPGLADEDRVLHGPDLSLEASYDELRHLDTFGHGTHLGGIIAAADPLGIDPDDPDRIQGIAPGSRLISIKVAEQRGVTDVSSVIAAIDWVIANRNRDGLDIGVLSLAFATDSIQHYTLDPLSFAVEQAWRSGIVVVVAAGNDGNGSGSLPMPARNPFVLAVGSVDTGDPSNPDDDQVAPYSNAGTSLRAPDVLAPGSALVSLRSPGSYLDLAHPEARIGQSMFRGSGTSQAAAVAAGLVALLRQRHPSYTPDQILHLLTSTADPLPGVTRRLQGDGVIDVKSAAGRRLFWPALTYAQIGVPSTGLGSIDGARGTLQVVTDEVPLVGEVDVFGQAFNSVDWALRSTLGTAFGSDGTWNGNRWAGSGWNGNRWAGNRWAGTDWAGNRWAGSEWTGNRWAGNRWAGDGWTGNRWAGGQWSSQRWSTAAWE